MNLTVSNQSLLDSEVTSGFGGSKRTQRMQRAGHYANASANSELSNEGETDDIPEEVAAPALKTVEKTYFGMKPKTAIIVGSLLVVCIVGYFYLKNKNSNAILEAAA